MTESEEAYVDALKTRIRVLESILASAPLEVVAALRVRATEE